MDDCYKIDIGFKTELIIHRLTKHLLWSSLDFDSEFEGISSLMDLEQHELLLALTAVGSALTKSASCYSTALM